MAKGVMCKIDVLSLSAYSLGSTGPGDFDLALLIDYDGELIFWYVFRLYICNNYGPDLLWD